MNPNMQKNSPLKWERSAKPFRMALGSLIIKEKLGISDRETVEQIRENPTYSFLLVRIVTVIKNHLMLQ